MHLRAPSSQPVANPAAELDSRLMAWPAREVDTLLEGLGPVDWEGTGRVVAYHIDRAAAAHAHLAVEWTLPGRFAWLSVRHPRPPFALLKALLDRAPQALGWKGCAMPAEQAPWVGACLLPDRRAVAGDKLLARVLELGLAGATDSQRVDRAARILGQGVEPAVEAQAAWGPSGWEGLRSWSSSLMGLYLAATHPQVVALDPINPWCRWSRALEAAGLDPAQRELALEQALAWALLGWRPFLRADFAASGQCISQDDIAALWQSLAIPESTHWGPAMRGSLETLALDALRQIQAWNTPQAPLREPVAVPLLLACIKALGQPTPALRAALAALPAGCVEKAMTQIPGNARAQLAAWMLDQRLQGPEPGASGPRQRM